MTKRLMRTPANGSLFFKGRPGDMRLGEWAKPVDSVPQKTSLPAIVLVGCADDQGVLLNRGRAGAKLGPDGVRKYLYQMVVSEKLKKKVEFYDLGNLIPTNDIRKTHEVAFEISESLGKSRHTAIFIGGGHDFAAPNFLGFVSGARPKKTGLMNVDPHLDVRELENGLPHSGTPFRQLLESSRLDGLVQFGIRENRNLDRHFAFCKESGATIVTLDQIRSKKKTAAEQFEGALKKLVPKRDCVGLTIDMDSCYETEGTSAAPVVGFSTWDLLEMARIAGETKSVSYLEIAEVAPPLDPFERSGRIAAEVVFSFLSSRANLF